MAIDPAILHAWLSGRSIVRGVSQPVADDDGFRVDSNIEVEVCRWIFAGRSARLEDLGRVIREPRHFLKLCDEAGVLRSMLPDRWQLHAPNYVMQSGGAQIAPPPIAGYTIDVRRTDALVQVRMWSDAGDLAASGYGGETADVFVYDRIVTTPEHRRKGLGRAVMAALQAARNQPDGTELLVATDDGRALYEQLGWRVISPYATASITA